VSRKPYKCKRGFEELYHILWFLTAKVVYIRLYKRRLFLPCVQEAILVQKRISRAISYIMVPGAKFVPIHLYKRRLSQLVFGKPYKCKKGIVKA
jgi:hypothetical protein